jgi:abortive infection bacteriophage resistance protein
MYPLLKMPKTAHLYKEGSTFKKVMMLYRFDKKLRLLMFNEIEKIEIAIRRAVMQTNLLRILPTIVDFR